MVLHFQKRYTSVNKPKCLWVCLSDVNFALEMLMHLKTIQMGVETIRINLVKPVDGIKSRAGLPNE